MARLVRKVFECTDCGYKWLSPWYEPAWLGRLQAIQDHKSAHAGLVNMWDDWASYYSLAERSRIIKLLESKSECKPESGHDWNGDCYCEIIALIKGENK
jgi:hypothetical protein